MGFAVATGDAIEIEETLTLSTWYRVVKKVSRILHFRQLRFCDMFRVVCEEIQWSKTRKHHGSNPGYFSVATKCPRTPENSQTFVKLNDL